jgi:hypothetical protein
MATGSPGASGPVHPIGPSVTPTGPSVAPGGRRADIDAQS